MDVRKISVVTAILALGMSAGLSADRIKLRSGKIVDGTFVGADSKTVRFLLPSGTRSDFAIGDVEGVEFTARKPPAPAPDPAVAPAPVLVPSGIDPERTPHAGD